MIIRISNISLVHMMNVVDNVLTGEEGVGGELCSSARMEIETRNRKR